jgi:hypothetical protein
MGTTGIRRKRHLFVVCVFKSPAKDWYDWVDSGLLQEPKVPRRYSRLPCSLGGVSHAVQVAFEFRVFHDSQ